MAILTPSDHSNVWLDLILLSPAAAFLLPFEVPLGISFALLYQVCAVGQCAPLLLLRVVSPLSSRWMSV